jgi:hypothetical protein
MKSLYVLTALVHMFHPNAESSISRHVKNFDTYYDCLKTRNEFQDLNNQNIKNFRFEADCKKVLLND